VNRLQIYYQLNKERLKAQARARYATKREEIRQKLNEYGRKNRVAAKERLQKWRKDNPDKAKEQSRRYYANSVARRAHVKLETAYRRAAIANRKCICCTNIMFRTVYAASELVGGEVDHIKAIALGGKHCVKNLQILSVEEHKEKTKRDLAECRRLRAAAK
jgi:5-methylcytosine-specific restriction endonuclease McrA